MLTVSKPVTASQAVVYYRNEYTNPGESLNAAGRPVEGRWHGKLAERWGLIGGVTPEQFEHLCEGRHPETGGQLVRHVAPRSYRNRYGKEITASAHRAGWDATFSAPKTVSLAAVAGGDGRVREAHRVSVDRALDALERHAQARMGGSRAAETTGRIVAARFEHDEARPDRASGYAAPQLHTHVIIFNVTETESGAAKPVQPLELYRTQQYATAVYRISLAERLGKLGYEVEADARTGAPEIKGFSAEYVRESSPRGAEVRRTAVEMRARLAEGGTAVKDGAGLRQAAARVNRAGKNYDRGLMAERVARLEAEHGNQAGRLRDETLRRGPVEYDPAEVKMHASRAVTAAREGAEALGERIDRRRLAADALRHGLSGSTYEAVTAEFEARESAGEFAGLIKEVSTERSAPSPARGRGRDLTTSGTQSSMPSREVGRQAPARKISADEVLEVFNRLRDEGRVVEIPERGALLRAVVEDYCSNTEGALVVAWADGRLGELNGMIRDSLRDGGRLGRGGLSVKVYEGRAGMDGVERAEAAAYAPGEDVVRFGRSSRVFGVGAGDYARVISADPERNVLTVATADGREIAYNPARLSGVAVFRESEREFAEGDRVRFDMPSAGRRIASGTLGTVEELEEGGGLRVRLDGGRVVGLGADELSHLDYGYAVGGRAPEATNVSHLIAVVEPDEPSTDIRLRVQSVVWGRPRFDARVYTEDAEGMCGALARAAEIGFAGGRSGEPPSSDAVRAGAEISGAESESGAGRVHTVEAGIALAL